MNHNCLIMCLFLIYAIAEMFYIIEFGGKTLAMFAF